MLATCFMVFSFWICAFIEVALTFFFGVCLVHPPALDSLDCQVFSFLDNRFESGGALVVCAFLAYFFAYCAIGMWKHRHDYPDEEEPDLRDICHSCPWIQY